MNVTHSFQENDQQHPEFFPVSQRIENDEEPIVTSTSNDLIHSSPVHVQQQPSRQHNIELLITSPARISSSTGNDCSLSSPLQQPKAHPQQEELQQHTSSGAHKVDLTADGSSEEDSRSQHEAFSSLLTQQQHQKAVNAVDRVIATTSAVRYNDSQELAANSAAEEIAMVARNLSAAPVADSSAFGNTVVDSATPSEAPVNHKIILKLPRATATKSESQMDADAATSSSSSNSSTSGEDTRKVEPLKINLHTTHATMQQHSVPKITIKPIIKKQTEETDASSSADEHPPIPKLTIKSSTATVQHSSSAASEPHIVPKLTIRAAGSEEGSGASHSASILPRLTIKMSDPQAASSSSAIAHNVSSANCSTACSAPLSPAQPAAEQAPLPKLTIKTSMDGTSNSILSLVSPTSLSGSSTSSSSSSVSIASTSLSPVSLSIPKLTIKTIAKAEEFTVPKLTIKTNAAGNSECASTSTATAAEEDVTVSKIPKLTIKTGQEHAVIITQHSAATHAQSVPRLTIKTKSLDAAVESAACSEQADASDERPPEKVPKITIKTSDISDKPTDSPKFSIKSTTQLTEMQQPAIPKLTITVSNVDFGGNGAVVTPGTERGPQSPLVGSELPGTSRKIATISPSTDRVPKLMISRQDAGAVLVVSNHSADGGGATENKFVPKLTIKTSSLPDTSETKESKTAKFSIKTLKTPNDEEKIPKLTIKSMTTGTVATMPLQHSSEDSDECVSLSSCSSPVPPDDKTANAKVVPKLTIKNLSSPQPTVKKSAPESPMTASKKCSRNPAAKNDISTSENENIENIANLPQRLMEMNDIDETIDEAFAVVTAIGDMRTTLPTTNGGESNSSQEFCGFNDNTTDCHIDEASLKLLNIDEEQERRHSDDMDIDEALQQQHEPQIFNNVGHFGSNNDENETYIATDDPHSETGYMLVPLQHPQLTHVIDTVDLTSSPSPSSSPAHFNYADTDAPEVEQPKASDFLLDRLQQHREASVIQQTTNVTAHSVLLNKLAVHANEGISLDNRNDSRVLPALQGNSENCMSNSIKYPHLTERLLANGIVHTAETHSTNKTVMSPSGSVILESIEILDTPDGSPHSSLDGEAVKFAHHLQNIKSSDMFVHQLDNCNDVDSHNNYKLMAATHANLKRHMDTSATNMIHDAKDLKQDILEISPNKLRRIENDSSTMATITILTNDIQEPTTTVITTSPTMIQSNHCRDFNNEVAAQPKIAPALPQTLPHRSRKQKHEHLLRVPDEEQDPLEFTTRDVAAVGGSSNTIYFNADSVKVAAAELSTPTGKRRGRPRKEKTITPLSSSSAKRPKEQNSATPLEEEKAVKSRLRGVQLLRKRLAIDMVDTEQAPSLLDEHQLKHQAEKEPPSENVQSARRDRVLRTPQRTSRRSVTPNTVSIEAKGKQTQEIEAATRKHQRKKSIPETSAVNHHQQHFGGGSNSSISSTSSLSSTTTAAAVTMAAQIDLTMSSSSSSNGSNTVTTMEAGGSRAVHSMLPPTTILSSSDPLFDVVIRPNDFSSIAAQHLRSPIKSRRDSIDDANTLLTPPSARSRMGSRTDSQDDDGGTNISGADNSGDDSASSSSAFTVGRGRGRGRGRSSGRGSSAGTRGGTRTPRIGRGASSVAKAIAMSRPRCVGGLKHTPDPQRLKGLFSPAPQVFEEDTRMSADLSQVQATELSQPSVNRQLDFLTNEESQSSFLSTNSILDPNTVAAVQNGAQLQKRPKKKKMEVCVSEETELTVASIAEYDWPPPKGCCPSKNRDTFMIQEQVALYLGIKSFKRKYPDLPRRQVDMEERNWLQEKNLVSERMCDLGITAVWASDILDIMYTDFYEKYEEYKDFIRQKHLREIETKQKSLGLNVVGRGLQARDRAILSVSKWNSYFNKSRKDERVTCLDLQTFTVNVPSRRAAITMLDPSTKGEVLASLEEAGISEAPPALLKPSLDENARLQPMSNYPLALVPGQYCEKYRNYTQLELRSYPINTVLDDPQTLHERLNQVPSIFPTSSDTETESATETTNKIIPVSHLKLSLGKSYSKRLPVRRSRRARTNAVHSSFLDMSERGITKCDNKNGQHQKEEQRCNSDDSCSEEKDSASATSTSASESSSSETDSGSESSCFSADEAVDSPCGVCQRTQNRNLKNLPEVFLKCYTCRRKVHPSCVEMPHRMTMRARNYNWQCADCKCCIKCKRKQDQNKMLFCEQCDRGFHIYCIEIKTVPEGRWSCERCSVCMRCGATKPEGLSQSQQGLVSPLNSAGGQLQAKPIKHKKVKWINEYRIDHITKLREHCSMLCVPCGRAKASNKKNLQHTGSGAAVTNSLMSPPPARSAAAGSTS